MNYYQLFELPESPLVNKGIIQTKYFKIQKKTHPDFYINATEFEQEEAMRLSSEANKAFDIFMDELKTIGYFLRQKGYLEDDEKYQLPSDFLMEMMEINERIDDGENENVRQEIKGIETELKHGVLNILEKDSRLLEGTDYQQIKAYYFQKKYLERILVRLVD
jgi:molecular chaperone HscB